MTSGRDWRPKTAAQLGVSLDGEAEGVAIRPLTETEWHERAPALAPAAREWLSVQGFDASPGSFAHVPDGSGLPGEIWLGVAAQAKAADFAALSAKAPAGSYRIVPDVAQATDALGWHRVVLGWALGNYHFETGVDCARPAAILHVPSGSPATSALNQAAAIRLTRDLVNVPAQDLGPAQLSAATQAIASHFGAETHEIIGDALLEEGFPAIHAVGRAAPEQPRLVEMRWGQPDQPAVTLIGKGVCFDTGGLNLKAMAGMRHMKRDMGGAAVVLGLSALIMSERIPVRLRVLLPIVENSVAGNAMRPGDVVPTRDGATIEIENTDCEGRMILADALTAAVEADPELIVDCATLTGSARTAFGSEIQALFASSDDLGRELQDAGVVSGDALWHMPLWQGYRKRIDAPVGDLLNMAPGGYAGAITAALFLGHFARDAKQWAHLDISAWNDSAKPGCPVGGEATGLSALFEYIRGRYA